MSARENKTRVGGEILVGRVVRCRASIQLLSFDRYRQMREPPISSITKFLYLPL
jgi:hypothetical protein